MPDFSSIEERLEQLVPRDLSEGGKRSLFAKIDDLASDVEVETAELPRRDGQWSWQLWTTAAACVALLGALVAIVATPGNPVNVFVGAERSDGSGRALSGNTALALEALDSRSLLQPVDFEGDDIDVRLDDQASWPVRSTSYRVVTQHTFREPVSGILVTVSEPAEEQILMCEQLY